MHTSPLHDDYAALGLEVVAYHGSRTTVRTGEPPVYDPWPAHQVVLYDASWLAVIEVAGPDARKWLNGMITADTRGLAPGAWVAAYQLDPKGKILATLDVLCLAADRFWLLTDEDQRPGLLERLQRFRFISKLTLSDLSATHSCLMLRGEDAGVVWRELAGDPETLAFPGRSGGREQLLVVGPGANVAAIWRAAANRLLRAGCGDWERDRLLHRIPAFDPDLVAGVIAQEAGEPERLSFTKGCYVGQEIVERVRARGNLHRAMAAVVFGAPVTAGSGLVAADGETVGTLTSTAPLSAGGTVGMGLVRKPHDAPGTPLMAAGVTGVVR